MWCCRPSDEDGASAVAATKHKFRRRRVFGRPPDLVLMISLSILTVYHKTVIVFTLTKLGHSSFTSGSLSHTKVQQHYRYNLVIEVCRSSVRGPPEKAQKSQKQFADVPPFYFVHRVLGECSLAWCGIHQ